MNGRGQPTFAPGMVGGDRIAIYSLDPKAAANGVLEITLPAADDVEEEWNAWDALWRADVALGGRGLAIYARREENGTTVLSMIHDPRNLSASRLREVARAATERFGWPARVV